MQDFSIRVGETPEVIRHVPSKKETVVVSDVFSKFEASKREKDATYSYLDGKSLIDYINESVNRFNTNEFWREGMEDWQSNLHQPFIRNKVISVLSKVVDSLPTIEYKNRNLDDFRKSDIINSLSDYFDQIDNTEELMVYSILEALVKGTVVGFEGFEEVEKDSRDIQYWDSGDDIMIKEGKRIVRRLFGAIVPIEEFYPASVGIRRIEDMPYCFRRKTRTHSEFLSRNQKYSRAKDVEAVKLSSEDDSEITHKDYISQDVAEGQVEEIEYWNQLTDEYVKIANGVWLNPIIVNGEEVVSPIPYNHKSLPFWSFIYEPFGEDFFFGKSLADKLSVLNDVLDVLDNMLLDQSFLSVFTPIVISGTDPIQDDFLVPGRRIAIDTGGLPLRDMFMPLQQQSPSGWHQFILNYTKRILEETSVDSVQQGSLGGGERITATAVRAASGGVVSLLGLFAKFIKFGLYRKYLLRGKNILQFSTQKDSPMVEQVLGIGGSELFNKAFQVFIVDGQVLPAGRRGTKIIAMYKKENEMPTGQESKVVKTILETENKPKRFSILNVTPEYIRNMEFDMKLVPNVKNESGRDLERALAISKTQTYMSLFPDLINREEVAAELIEKFGDDPSRILKEGVLNPQPAMTPQMGGALASPQNTVAQATGISGAGGTNETRDIMSQML